MQDGGLVRDVPLSKLADEILGEIDWKRQIVLRVNQQRLSIAQPFEIPRRTDRLP